MAEIRFKSDERRTKSVRRSADDGRAAGSWPVRSAELPVARSQRTRRRIWHSASPISRPTSPTAPPRRSSTCRAPATTRWMMTCAALVLFMTLPGLALFYGGLVRRKNVLSVLRAVLRHGRHGRRSSGGRSATASRSTTGSPFLGGIDLRDAQGRRRPRRTRTTPYWVSQNVFSMFQLMFAIITPALIVGAIAERMKFSALMLFLALWMLVVYFPMAHMVWGIDGFMNGVWNADAEHQGDRLRGRHRGAHDLGLVGAGALHHARQAQRLRHEARSRRTAWC